MFNFCFKCNYFKVNKIESFIKSYYIVIRMGPELIIYKNPGLVTDVKPGHVIEALPGSEATSTIWRSEPSFNSPTNVFGYVRGNLREAYLTHKQGTTLVESIVPFGGRHMSEETFRTQELESWGANNIETYLLIGELKGVEPIDYDSKFNPVMMDDSVRLSPEQVDIVREQILNFLKERGNKDYVVNTPDGQSFPLSEIVLTLEENIQD